MLHIQLSSESWEGKEFFNKLDIADYTKKSFSMFGGKEKTVKLLVKNSLAGVIIDRFGFLDGCFHWGTVLRLLGRMMWWSKCE
mgnify:CR=1 FL=1